MVHPMRPLVLCGPSGSGKSSLLRLLFEEFPDKFGFSVSHTTRSPRPGEIDGKHYHFTSMDEMKSAIERGEFIESATFSNNMYGTSKAAVAAVQAEGKICVLDIDVQGVKQIKQTDLNPLYIFIKPPSMADLEKRLRDRKTETEESLQRRLATAASELPYGETPGNFHLVVTNDNLEKAYSCLRDFILKELLKPSSSSDLWCCLGSASTDHNSGDYYYMSTNTSNDCAEMMQTATVTGDKCSNVKSDSPRCSNSGEIDCQAVSQCHSDQIKGGDTGGSDSGRGCDSGWEGDSGGGCDSRAGGDSGGGCDFGVGGDSGGGFDSGTGGDSGGGFDSGGGD